MPTIDTVSSTQKNRVDIRIGCLNFAQVVARLFLDPIKSVHLFVLDTVRSAQKNRLTIIIGHLVSHTLDLQIFYTAYLVAIGLFGFVPGREPCAV